MAQQQSVEPVRKNEQEKKGGTASPQTDPTNPVAQETTGQKVASEHRDDLSGQTDRERHEGSAHS